MPAIPVLVASAAAQRETQLRSHGLALRLDSLITLRALLEGPDGFWQIAIDCLRANSYTAGLKPGLFVLHFPARL
jgi:hypothetical protein